MARQTVDHVHIVKVSYYRGHVIETNLVSIDWEIVETKAIP